MKYIIRTPLHTFLPDRFDTYMEAQLYIAKYNLLNHIIVTLKTK